MAQDIPRAANDAVLGGLPSSSPSAREKSDSAKSLPSVATMVSEASAAWSEASEPVSNRVHDQTIKGVPQSAYQSPYIEDVRGAMVKKATARHPATKRVKKVQYLRNRLRRVDRVRKERGTQHPRHQ